MSDVSSLLLWYSKQQNSNEKTKQKKCNRKISGEKETAKKVQYPGYISLHSP